MKRAIHDGTFRSCSRRAAWLMCVTAIAASWAFATTDAGVDRSASAYMRGHENTEWSIAYAFNLADANRDLPRVLLVGDSIANGYQRTVCDLLSGKVNVSYWISSYCVTSPNYLKFLSIYLDEAKYDVVHFNNGLHSLITPTKEYERGLVAALELVRRKQPNAKIVWTTCTPMRDPVKTAKVREINAVAERVVARLGGIATDDIFSTLDPLDREAHWRDGCHLKPGANAIVGEQVAKCILSHLSASARPVPRPALATRLADGPDVIGIVHWGLNTYTDREWGYGDEDPAILNPARFDADQIVGAAKAGGIGGLVVVAKHHDGFCLWPTKTTAHNISKTPFWRGTGNGERGRDYVKEMSEACRRAGLKFGVYVSPWDRHDADYGTGKYVAKYHEQIKELLGGGYGEIFEMWFDGANGGDGWYGGAKEKRKIGASNAYYRFGEVFRFVRAMQPKVTIFAGESDDSDFRWPGNERGILDPDSRATICTTGGFADGKFGNPNYDAQKNAGSKDGFCFRACESDFPLRKGWFYHERERGTTKRAAYLAQRYVGTVGNGGTMNIGIAPNKDGLLDAEDVRELKGFGEMRKALFACEVNEEGKPFNVVELREDLSNGEQVDGWRILADGREILSGKAIGNRRIRLLPEPILAKTVKLEITAHGGNPLPVTLRRYYADPQLVKTVLAATGDCGETDTAKWQGAATSNSSK